MVMRRRISVLLSLTILAFGLLFVPVYAQEGPGGSGLQISPTKSDVVIASGERRDISITVKNVTNGGMTVKTFINDFESDGKTGNPKLIIDPKKRSPYSLADMIKGLSDFDLKAQESKEVKLSIAVPTDASPGAYFSAVRFAAIPKAPSSEAPKEGEQQIALTASLAHLVFVEIPGEISEQIQLQSFRFEQAGKSKSFFTTKPDKATIGIENLGNGFSRPFGKVAISRFGKEVYTYDVNNTDPKAIVLPKSSRILTNEVKNITKPGKYTAVASVAYGNGSEVINRETSFWYVPVWLIVTLVGLVLALIATGYAVYRKKFGKGSAKKRRA